MKGLRKRQKETKDGKKKEEQIVRRKEMPQEKEGKKN
jgi:hypothetical protein